MAALALLMAALGLAMAAATLLLQQRATNAILHRRIRALAPAAPADPAAERAPSIRVAESSSGNALTRLVRFRPDIPEEHLNPWQLVVLLGGAVGVLAFWQLQGALGGVLALAAGAAATVLTCRCIFGWQHWRYCDALFQQIPEALGQVVRSLRAGLPMSEALRSLSRDMPAPTRQEFARVIGDVAIGRPLEQAIYHVYERTGLTEFSFLAVTLGLQAQTGGSLAETLDNLADMVRRRVGMIGRAKALSAEARTSAGILVALPFVSGLGMAALRPGYISVFTDNPSGQRMALIGAGLMILGVLVMRWLIARATKG